MPATANGTPYTVRTATLGNHGAAYWAVADAHAGDTNIPTVLYAHGAGGAANQFATLSSWKGLRDWLIDNGWAWVEGEGGAGTGAQNWGNTAARAAYPAYLDHVSTTLDLGPVVLLGRSMGGLVTGNLYAHDTAGRYAGWVNNSGVSTAFVGTTSGAKNPAAATGWYFTPAMWDAWGVSSVATLQAAMASAGAIPEAWAAAKWAGKKILNCYGDADTTVPWETRGAAALRSAWAGEPAIDRVAVRAGGDHSGANGSYLQVDDMVSFLTEVSGAAPAERVAYRLLSARMLVGGQRYAVTL